MRSVHAYGAGLIVMAALAAACGTTDESVFDPQDPSGTSSSGGSSGASSGFASSSGGSSSGGTVQTLRIDPPRATVTAAGTLAAPTGSAAFKAYVGTSTTPVDVTWSLDDVRFGAVDGQGTFSPKAIGGVTKLRARLGQTEAVAEVEVLVKASEDFAALDDPTKTKLRAGGSADGAFKWLYPYDKTVFPRGLSAPVMQLAGSAPAAFRVHVKSKRFEAEGFYPGGTGAARVKVAEDWWKAVTLSAGPGDAVTVDVTKIEGDSVTGPVSETWNVAGGSLRGTVYYNSYNSNLANQQAQTTGALLAVKPGRGVEVLAGRVQSQGAERGCIVCHSVSASGNRIATGIDWTGSDPRDSGLLDLANGVATMRMSTTEGRTFGFAALSPDGNFAVGNANRDGGPGIRGLSGNFPSKLYDARTGTEITTGFFGDAPRYFLSPAFSPDSKRLVFNDKSSVTNGTKLGIVDVDLRQSPPAFSNYQELYAEPSGKVVAWPTFTPDGKGILFHVGDSFDTGGHSEGATLGRLTADMWYLDLATKQAVSLAALNGYSNGQLYLPWGEAEEAHLNYEPTMLPVPVGGYYWVVFTSRRALGNTIYNGPSSLNAAGDKAFDNGNALGRGFRKKLWVAAIDVNAPPGADVSHPAFYLEGQEDRAGNMRGFWALDQCKADGAVCEGGDECCGGFCRPVEENGAMVAKCVPPPASCANETEKCSRDADCCNAASGTRCLGGFCAVPSPSVPR